MDVDGGIEVVNAVNELVGLLDESDTSSEYVRNASSRLVSPDLLTPAQYYPGLPASPYHRLLLAVLEDAIRCFQRNLLATRGRRRILFRETKEWLFDTYSTAFMSFSVVCESLGIEPSLLRRQLRAWQAEASRGLRVRRLPRRSAICADKRIS
jgi:hypothetical protein